MTHHQRVQLLGDLDRFPKGTRQWKEGDLPDAQVNKQLLDEVFVISRIIKVEVRFG